MNLNRFKRFLTILLLFQFKLEDSTTSSTASNSQQPPTSPTNGTTQDPLKTTNATSTTRRQNSTESVQEKDSLAAQSRSDDDKGEKPMETSNDRLSDELICAENDKENDSRSGPASQAMIQRRRRPKRRSTGVVHVDMEVNI